MTWMVTGLTGSRLRTAVRCEWESWGRGALGSIRWGSMTNTSRETMGKRRIGQGGVRAQPLARTVVLPFLTGGLVWGVLAAEGAPTPTPTPGWSQGWGGEEVRIAGNGDSLLDSLATVLVREGAPAAGILVLSGGEVSLAVAGERVAGSGIPVQANDPWHLGSNGKAMTAILAARLVEADLLTWESTLDDWAPPHWGPLPGWVADVTLAELLSHTGGLPTNLLPAEAGALVGVDSERDARADRRMAAEQVLARDPGGERGVFLYSNVGYMLAGLLMEEAAGRSWEDLMAKEVFGPLGLSSAGMGPPEPGGSREVPEAPWGHLGGMDDTLIPLPPGGLADNPPALGPAGRVHMSLADYGAFLQAVLAGVGGEALGVGSARAKGREAPLLTAESWNRLVTPPPTSPDYALGWGLVVDPEGVRRECPLLQHAGSNGRWWAHVRLDPARGLGVVVVLNEGRVALVRERSLEILESVVPVAVADCRPGPPGPMSGAHRPGGGEARPIPSHESAPFRRLGLHPPESQRP